MSVVPREAPRADVQSWFEMQAQQVPAIVDDANAGLAVSRYAKNSGPDEFDKNFMPKCEALHSVWALKMSFENLIVELLFRRWEDRAMRRTKSSDADLSHDDLAQVIRRAEIARVQFLRENSGSALRWIGWSTLACGLALLVVAGSGPSPRQIRENTTLLEQLATKLRPMEKIAPGTAGQITGLLRKPDYGCRQGPGHAGHREGKP